MEVEFAFIAESADAREGLFYVLRGGADIWHVQPGSTYPLGIGPLSFVVRLIGAPQEVGAELPLSFDIVDADGRSIGPTGEGKMTFQSHPLDRTRTTAALVHYRIAPLLVPRPGAYFFQLMHQGRRLCQVPFWVVEGTPPDSA